MLNQSGSSDTSSLLRADPWYVSSPLGKRRYTTLKKQTLLKWKTTYLLKWKEKCVSAAHNVILDNAADCLNEKGKVLRQEKIFSLLPVSQKFVYTLEIVAGHQQSVSKALGKLIHISFVIFKIENLTLELKKYKKRNRRKKYHKILCEKLWPWRRAQGYSFLQSFRRYYPSTRQKDQERGQTVLKNCVNSELLAIISFKTKAPKTRYSPKVTFIQTQITKKF